jgi:copper chaperone
MTTRTYSVPGISCGHCKTAIESELQPIDGVESAIVDIDAKTVTVRGDVAEEVVRAAVDEAGYEVVAVN